MALGGCLLSSAAQSGTFDGKTMRDAHPAREVERKINLTKGWLEFSFGYHHKVGTGAWGADGSRNPFTDARWTYQTEALTIRYGISPRAELWWYAEAHQARLVNDALGTDTRDNALGDQIVGYRLSLFEQEAPLTSVVFEAHMKLASGKEQAGTYIGGPMNVSGFVFSTGTPDLYLGGAAKYALGPIGLTGRVGYMRRLSAVVNYLIEVETYQFQGRMKPGDEIQGELEVLAQIGPVTVSATPKVEYRFKTKMGTSAKGLFPNKNLRPVAGSNGLALDLEGRLRFQINRNFDVELYTLQPLVGEDLQFFPLEDIHPTLGATYGGSLEVRY
jgi:hypothetical protein